MCVNITASRFQTIFVGTAIRRTLWDSMRSVAFGVAYCMPISLWINYREPIYEEGKQLMDTIYLKQKLQSDIDVKKVADVALEAEGYLKKWW